MTPQSKWAAETGLDPDDYSVWDNDQSSQRAKAHRWAFARADEYCPEEIHIVMNRNCGCAQLVKGYEVATLDVDEEGFPTATWYGAVRPGCLSCVRMGELDQSWFDRNPERRSAAGPVDLDDRGDLGEDPYIGLTDMWNGTPQRDEWGRVGCYAWAIDRLMGEDH